MITKMSQNEQFEVEFDNGGKVSIAQPTSAKETRCLTNEDKVSLKNYIDLATSQAKPTHIYNAAGSDRLNDKGSLAVIDPNTKEDSFWSYYSIKFIYSGYRVPVG